MIPILSLFNHSWTVVTNLHLFGDKESHHVWLFARCHQQLMEPARSAAHPQQSSASAQTQSSSLEKVSKPRFWLCNYLFSYNCRFSCIIRPINITFFLLLPRILNDAVRSQKEGKWYQENPVGRGAMCGWVRDKPCRDFGLGVLCKSRTTLMTVTVWHYILKWHQGNYKLKFLLENHLCMVL